MSLEERVRRMPCRWLAHPCDGRESEQALARARIVAEVAALEVRCAALAKIVRQNVEWSGPDTGLCWDIVPNSNPCTHPGCIERRALIGEGA